MDWARKLTRTPAAMTRADVDTLRAVGLSDRDVLDACEVVAYYAYVNRIADGLGVAVEPWFATDGATDGAIDAGADGGPEE